ncbi:hypothetical protein M404DRAFT_571455 [Pisolithus tinctorius Marx 270]|uniref:Uncharacterized protein n=1 Tax=Pisolithus tinctorius Marx 270 TaxID=870435 RepID=A0A0C3PVQ2_PISTI|nr:hypothetical protein M404DRAFT_571455 [Pisolithus tinctorius Marx 270]
MDPSTSSTDCSLADKASETSDTDEVNSSTARVYFGPILSPEKKLIAQSTAQQRVYKFDAFDAPLRRSPRLSRAASPRLQSPDANAGDDIENNPSGHHEDPFFQDEPSSVLAGRIMRAFDNPSPPPQRRMHTGVEYTPGKGRQFPLLDASAPPSPFRTVNLLERLNQLAEPMMPSSPFRPSPLVLESKTIPASGVSAALQPDLTSFKSCSESTLQNIVLECADGVTKPHSASTIDIRTAQAECSTQGSSLPRSSAQEVSYITEEFPGVSGQQKDSENGTVRACAPQSSNFGPPSLPVAGDAGTMEALDSLREGSADEDEVVATNARSRGKRKLAVARNHDKLCQDRLGSLSPQSEGLLTQLLPSSRERQVPPVPEQDQEPISSNPSTLQPTLTTSPVPARSTVAHDTSLKAGHFHDSVHRTPARRVPIHDALVDATPSLQKTARRALLESQSRHFSNTSGLVFSRPDNLSHSPAKRVLVAGCTESPSRPTTRITLPPMPIILRTRSASVEPQPSILSSVRSRSVEPSPASTRTRGDGKDKEPMFPHLTTLRATPTLPFPLVPVEKAEAGSTHPIPEENETEETTVPDATRKILPVGPDKSHLRQRSVGSRIPRMNAKPYARPQTGANRPNTISISKLELNSKPIPPTRPCGEGGHDSAHEPTDQNVNGLSSSVSSAAKTLKRKRALEAGASEPSFRSASARQVMPGTFGGKHAAKPPNSFPELSAQAPSPQKPNTPILFRKVVDGMLAAHYPPTKASVESGEKTLPDSSAPRLPSEAQQSRPLPVTALTNPGDRNPKSLLPQASAVALKENDLGSQPSKRKSDLKRSSRTRQATSNDDGVFSNTSRSSQAGRRPPTRGEESGFMGMSATALRALTSSNTAKNQQTVAIFATEVIRKDGLRPESPAVKIRTILQKEKEEQDRQRKERAQRRARRSEEGNDMEGLSEHTTHTLDGHGHDENVDLTPTRRFRAPGDEEDYETPERLSPIKRPQFGEGNKGEQARPTKQVKWCRGLATTVYIEDVHPMPRFQQHDPHAKGCLAPSSKNLRLDTLGNIMDIDSRPPLQLVQDHVVIKKFMYDNDVEAEPVPMRTTRSKNKKPKG